MNVKELREALAELPDDLMVVVRGYEGGVNEVDYLERYKVRLRANAGAWYYGQHEPVREYETLSEGTSTADVVELR